MSILKGSQYAYKKKALWYKLLEKVLVHSYTKVKIIYLKIKLEKCKIKEKRKLYLQSY